MKLATRTSITISICLCVMIAVPMLVQAETAAVGVSQGNIFQYNLSASWNSPLNATVPVEYLETNQTEFITVTITAVSGSLISSQLTTHFRNGAEITSDATCNIDTGESSGGSPPFIGANLGINGLVNPSASEPWYINETVTRTYKDSTRETNHLTFEFNETSDLIGDYRDIYDYWFDKSTGVLVEYSVEFSYSDVTTITHSEIIYSSLWSVNEKSVGNTPIPTNPTTLNIPFIAAIIITISIITIATVVLFKRRTKKTEASAVDGDSNSN